jgi:hypothetical protein
VLVRSTYADADSARLLAAIDHVRREGGGLLTSTQEVLLPHVLLRPLDALGEIPLVSLFDVLAMVALTGLVAAMARRLSGSVVGGVTAALALLAAYELLYRTTTAPMYCLMLLLGYGGLWLTVAALRSSGRRQWLLAAGAAGALVGSWEAHAVGQVFLAGPVLVLLLGPGRRQAVGAAKVLGAAALLAVPRLLVNVAEGGFTRLRSNRTDFVITQGYIELINRDFWGLPGTGGRSAFVRQLPDLAERTVGKTTLLLYGACLLVLLWKRATALLCGAVAAGAFVAVLVIAEPAPYPRYLLPVVPAVAVLCGIGIGAGVRRHAGTRPLATGVAGAVLVAGLGVAAVASLLRVTTDVDEQVDLLEQSGLEVVADRITDDRGVIGVRASRLEWVGSDAPIWSSQFLTEDEYVTFLTWPSDAAVLELLDRHDIGWVLVSPDRALELEYDQAWLGPAHGEQVRHVDAVAASPCFGLVEPTGEYRLYERRPCAAR